MAGVKPFGPGHQRAVLIKIFLARLILLNENFLAAFIWPACQSLIEDVVLMFLASEF